jgi:predicted membrane protein
VRQPTRPDIVPGLLAVALYSLIVLIGMTPLREADVAGNEAVGAKIAVPVLIPMAGKQQTPNARTQQRRFLSRPG